MTTFTAAEVFKRYGARMHRWALKLTGNAADADEVVGDALVLLWRKLHTFREDCALATWVHRVTANAAHLFHRKEARRPEKRKAEDALGRPRHGRALRRRQAERRAVRRPDEEAQEREEYAARRRLIDEAVARLPETYREVFALEAGGLANAAIGARLGLGLAAVKSRVRRARLLLRQALAPHFPDLAG